MTNKDFIKKAAQVIKDEVSVQIVKCKKQATQKVKRSKAVVRQKQIRERLEKQKKVIAAYKEKVKKLRNERATAKKNFDRVNGFTKVKAIWDAWKLKKDKSVEQVKILAKRELVKKVNSRLVLAIKRAQTKRARIALLWAR